MTLKLNGSSSGYTAIDAPAAAGSNTLVLPTNNGSANQYRKTDGNGNLTHNGSIVGSIDYAKGHCSFTHLPNAEFKVYAQTLSAHAGGVSYVTNGENSIKEIKARSVNAKQDGKVELLLLG